MRGKISLDSSSTMTEIVTNKTTHLHSRTSHLNQFDVENFLNQNVDFTKDYIINYLKTNKDFSENYFIQNASMEMFQKWYDQKINLRLNRKPSLKSQKLQNGPAAQQNDQKLPNPEKHSLTKLMTNNTSSQTSGSKMNGDVSPQGSVNQTTRVNGEESLDTLSELVHNNRSKLSKIKPKFKTKTFDDNNNGKEDGSSEASDVNLKSSKDDFKFSSLADQVQSRRPSLRKAQSAPAYKANLSDLISSSVYGGVPLKRDINIENHILKDLNEQNILIEIIKDVSKDLSLHRTCFRILLNYGFMIDVEKASIYISHQENGAKSMRLLLNHVKIEDGIQSGSLSQKLNNEEGVPLQKGIVGTIASSGECYISNCVSEDKLLHYTHDKWYDDSVKNALLHPINDMQGECIAVIVAINNKKGDFSDEEKTTGSSFLSFCGSLLTNAKVFEKTKEEFNRNRKLLELSHELFEESCSLNKVIQRVLNRAVEMFECKKCSLMLIDDPRETDERRLFSKLFQVTSSEKKEDYRFSKFTRDSVVFSSNFDPFIDGVSDPNVLNQRKNKKLILHSTPITSVQSGIYQDKETICVPIRNNTAQIIGVLKLIDRKENKPITCDEEQFLEAFSIFAGLGINNCIMYDNILKGQAHQKVALEALSYHTAARQSDVEKLKMSVIPSCNAFNLTSLTFDDFSLLENEMLTASIRMFMEFGFVKKYQIEYEVLCRFLITVKNNYRRVIYHNWRHAFNVTQSMFACLTAGKISEQLSSCECLALLVGCLCHDLDHRGTNNEFQMKTDSPLAKLYGTSTMEHHHFNRAIMILNSEGNNIFSQLQSDEYRNVMKLIKHAILATDLGNYIRQRETFSTAIKTKTFDTNKPENRAMLRSMLMTACDLSGITKPWDIQKRVVHLVTSEFFHQGDIERDRLNVEPKQMMDRKHILQLPKLQVQFFEMMGIPVYEVLGEFNENLKKLANGAKTNKSKWLALSQEIERGHVNPDIETVLHPVKNEDDTTSFFI